MSKEFYRFQKIAGILKEDYSNTIDTLYHGTTLKKALDIVKKGFSLENQSQKSGYGSNLGISLTYEYEIAKEHADWASEKFKQDPYIIKIPGQSFKLISAENFENIDNDFQKAHELYKKGQLDGIDLCNRETGDGCEEFEVFIFNLEKLNSLVKNLKIP
jgi:hypothetical protein